MRAKDGWLHYCSAEGDWRAVRIEEVAAVTAQRWKDPEGFTHDYSHLRLRCGTVYRVPERYAKVMPRVVQGEEDE